MLNKSKRLWTKTRQIKAIKTPFNVKELQSWANQNESKSWVVCTNLLLYLQMDASGVLIHWPYGQPPLMDFWNFHTHRQTPEQAKQQRKPSGQAEFSIINTSNPKEERVYV